MPGSPVEFAVCAALGLALAATGCFREAPDCGLDECARLQYEISTQGVPEPFHGDRRHIDTLDSGRLYVQVQIRQPPALAKRSAQVFICIGCEALFTNSRLAFDQPILAGADTLAAAVNLLDSAVVSKLGFGSPYGLQFHDHVRFKGGVNRISFASDLVLQGRRIGSVSLEKALFVEGSSSY